MTKLISDNSNAFPACLSVFHILFIVPTEAMLLRWFICAAVLNLSPGHSFSSDLSRSKRSDSLVPCDKGWFQYREKCFRVRGKLRSDWVDWEKASARCKQDGASLVSIHSKEELDFIVAFLLLDVSAYVWLGLHHRGGLTEFTWEDGSPVNYTNWRPKEPSNQPNEDCAVMAFDPTAGVIGQWNDRLCRDHYAYICQKKVDRRKKSQNPQICSAEESNGLKFRESCFHFVLEMKSWDNAEQHCKDNYNGHLATVLDEALDSFLDYALSKIHKQLWIGLKISDENQQKWASGWFVSYNRTDKDPGDVPDGHCVLRNSSKLWIVTPCSKMRPFICETLKVLPPVLKPPPQGSHCPEIPIDWIDLGGESCYFFETKNDFTWYQANYECNRRGGNLLSIHSQEEENIIQPFIKFIPEGKYIGLIRQTMNEDVFIWTDGTKMDYEKWYYTEPNSVAEKCGEIWAHSMEWNDVWCESKRGFICSVKKVAPNTGNEDAVDCAGGVSSKVLIGVSVCLVLVVLLGVVVYCVRSRNSERRKRSRGAVVPQNSPSNYRPKYRYSKQVQPELVVKEDPSHYESVY